MGNKKLIKSIKKKVVKQIEADLKKSVLKEFYVNTSNDQIKDIKTQILSEVQAEIFGDKNFESVEENLKSDVIGDIFATATEPIEIKLESDVNSEPTIKESDSDEKESSIHEHLGFKFDTERMSRLVTGKARVEPNKAADGGVERVESGSVSDYLSDKFQKLSGFPPFMHTQHLSDEVKERNSERIKRIEEIRSGTLKEQIKKSDTTVTPWANTSLFPVPQTRDFVKYGPKITPATKEDLTFFLGKLKDGISKLGKGEKNINYRYSKDDIYLFSYDKVASGNEDFSLSFELELNVKTLAAVVKKFHFNVDGFNFDSSFFELIDVVSVLNYMGMNILKYVDEIVGVNGTEENEIKPSKSSKQKQSKFSTKIESVVDDKKLLKLLKDNNINSYGELVEMSSALTSLKGVGSKTAEKIKNYIK
jgi:hypothetical protein